MAQIPVKESDLREWVRDLSRLLGYKFYFSWTSLHSPRGFPDLVLVSVEQKRVIYAELKTEKGQPSDKQIEWLDALFEAGQEVYLWRPHDIEGIAGIMRRSPEQRVKTW